MKLNTIPHRLSEGAGQLKQRFTSLLQWKQATLPLPALYDGPSPSEALAQDGLTRWLLLAVLSGAEEVGLKFLSMLVKGQDAERQCSLVWLEEHGCITKRSVWQRNFFWEPRREVIFFAITPLGEALLAQIEVAARAGSLGPMLEELRAESGPNHAPARDRFCRLAALIVQIGLLTLLLVMFAQLVPLLVSEVFR